MGITTKLCEVMLEAGYVQKDGRNDHYEYNFTSAKAVLAKVRVPLAKRGVAIVATTSETVRDEAVTNDKGKTGRYVNQRITLKLRDAETGEEAVFQGQGSGVDSGDKALMKANTAAMKYLVAAAFLQSWGDDPEAAPEFNDADAPEAKPDPKPRARRGPAPKAPAGPSENVAALRAVIDMMAADTIADVYLKVKEATGLSAAEADEARAYFREVRVARGLTLPTNGAAAAA